MTKLHHFARAGNHNFIKLHTINQTINCSLIGIYSRQREKQR